MIYYCCIDGDVSGGIIGGVTSSVSGIVNVGEYLETQQLSAVSNNQQLPSVSIPLFLPLPEHLSLQASNLYFMKRIHWHPAESESTPQLKVHIGVGLKQLLLVICDVSSVAINLQVGSSRVAHQINQMTRKLKLLLNSLEVNFKGLRSEVDSRFLALGCSLLQREFCKSQLLYYNV